MIVICPSVACCSLGWEGEDIQCQRPAVGGGGGGGGHCWRVEMYHCHRQKRGRGRHLCYQCWKTGEKYCWHLVSTSRPSARSIIGVGGRSGRTTGLSSRQK